MLRALAVTLAVGLLLLTAGPRVDAQDSEAMRFILQQHGLGTQSFRPRTPRAAPPPRVAPAPAVPRRSLPERSDAAPTDVALTPEAPPVAPRFTVHVIGDVMADQLAQGLIAAFAEEREIAITRHGRHSTGLVRADVLDWPAEAARLLAEAQQKNALVVALGLNDRQPIRDGEGYADTLSDRWRELYAQRVDALLAVAAAQRMPVLWAGLPIVESRRMSADYLAMNALVRARVEAAGQSFVDLWEGFVTAEGGYSAAGPDVGGTVVRLRASDGVHFSRAGARKAAYFLERPLRRLFEQLPSGEAGDALARLPPPSSDGGLGPLIPALSLPDAGGVPPLTLEEQVRRSLPGFTPRSITDAIVLPPDLPWVPMLRRLTEPQRHSLTAVPATLGGQLASGPPPPITAPADRERERALGLGLLPVPSPGRIDDPRPDAGG